MIPIRESPTFDIPTKFPAKFDPTNVPIKYIDSSVNPDNIKAKPGATNLLPGLTQR